MIYLKNLFIVLTGLCLFSSCANPGPFIERSINKNFPISSVVISRGSTTIYLSGVLTPPLSGDTTESQADRVFATIQSRLEEQGFGLDSIVQMRVYLVGEARIGGRHDFDGFNAAYARYFSPENYPARTVVQVVGLPVEGSLVEVEVIAVAGQ